MKRLLLVSHAETEWNAQGRFQGHADVPLNERGRRQAAALQARLAREPLQAIVASDLARAWETAAVVATPHALPLRPEPRLRELHFGKWEGMTYAEVGKSDPDLLAAWQSNLLNSCPPDGERVADLASRLQAFLVELAGFSESTILLVAHRGSLRILLSLMLGISPERHWKFRLDIASLSEVEWTKDKATIRRLNEIMLVEGLAPADFQKGAEHAR